MYIFVTLQVDHREVSWHIYISSIGVKSQDKMVFMSLHGCSDHLVFCFVDILCVSYRCVHLAVQGAASTSEPSSKISRAR